MQTKATEALLARYEKVMRSRELLYMRSRPWRERFKKHPLHTVWYALLDRFWYGVVALTDSPLLTMRTFWGADIIMPFPDYRSVLHHGLIDSRELPVEDYLIRNLKRGDVFLDIGANVGFYTLLCDALGAKPYAFEPSPETFAILTKNAPANAVLINEALMDTEGNIAFTDKGVASGTNTAIVNGTQDTLIEVGATTLDAYCNEYGVQPTHLKIDVEGAEASVLVGGEKTIATYRPVLIVETENAQVIERICSLGYTAYRFGARGEIIPFEESAIRSPNLLFLPLN